MSKIKRTEEGSLNGKEARKVKIEMENLEEREWGGADCLEWQWHPMEWVKGERRWSGGEKNLMSCAEEGIVDFAWERLCRSVGDLWVGKKGLWGLN